MQILNQLLQLLQQGITAIFDIFRTIWTWTISQILGFVNLPWGSMPIWKLAVALAIGAIASYLFFKALRDLWDHVEKILKAFAGLLANLVTVAPYVLGGGVLFAVLIWIVRTF